MIAPLLSLAGVILLCAHVGITDVDSLVRWCDAQLQQLPAPFNGAVQDPRHRSRSRRSARID